MSAVIPKLWDKLISTSVVFALLISACGTIDPEKSAVLVDGVKGPFREGGNIQVCIGSSRLVASSEGKVTHVCSSVYVERTSCTEDNECKRGESCVCGQCLVRICDETRPCAEQDVCRAGRCTQKCTEPSECARGETCIAGGCSPLCSHDSDCPYGSTCDAIDNACRVKTCVFEGECGIGRSCLASETQGDAREPELVDIQGEHIVFLEIAQPKDGATRRSIFRGVRERPGLWRVDEQPVISPDLLESTDVGAPTVWVSAGQLKALVVEIGDREGLAYLEPMNADGREFKVITSNLASPKESWESGKIGRPAFVSLGQHNWVLYEAGNPSDSSTGAGGSDGSATGTSGSSSSGASGSGGVGGSGSSESHAVLGILEVSHEGKLLIRNDQPWLSPPLSGVSTVWKNITDLRSPTAMVDGDSAYIYFAARGVEGQQSVDHKSPKPPANYSIGLVVTRDMKNLAIFQQGPVLARRTNFTTYLGELDPAVIRTTNTIFMAFAASDAQGTVAGLSWAEAQ